MGTEDMVNIGTAELRWGMSDSPRKHAIDVEGAENGSCKELLYFVAFGQCEVHYFQMSD